MKGYKTLEFSNISLEFLLGTGLILQSLHKEEMVSLADARFLSIVPEDS